MDIKAHSLFPKSRIFWPRLLVFIFISSLCRQYSNYAQPWLLTRNGWNVPKIQLSNPTFLTKEQRSPLLHLYIYICCVIDDRIKEKVCSTKQNRGDISLMSVKTSSNDVHLVTLHKPIKERIYVRLIGTATSVIFNTWISCGKLALAEVLDEVDLLGALGWAAL